MAVKRRDDTGESLLNLQTNEELSTLAVQLQEQVATTNAIVANLKGRISSLVDEIVTLKTDLDNTKDAFSKHLMTLAHKIEPNHKW